MQTNPTFVLELLRRYHHPEKFVNCPKDALSQSQIEYLCSVGLGPITYGTYGQWLEKCGRGQFEICQSADLTTRVIHAQLSNAAVDLVSELNDSGIQTVLLKGISTSDEYYDLPHCRVMGDVDFLFEEEETAGVEKAMARLGYVIDDRREANLNRAHHHHLPAVRHPETGVVLEAHTGLFRPESLPSRQPVFSRESMWEQTRPSTYRGHAVRRFSPEFQFVYTIAHWGFDSKWPVNLLSIVDTTHILQEHSTAMDWPQIAGWMEENDWLAGCVTILLTYLHAIGLVTLPEAIESATERSAKKLGRRNLKLFHRLIDTFPVGGRDKAGPLREEWSAQVFWEALLLPSSRFLRIPNACIRTIFSNSNRYNPIRMYRRMTEIMGGAGPANS